MTNKEKILQEAARAARIVKSWPEWKQNLLLMSLKSTNNYSRVPVRRPAQATTSGNS